ncbi:MAG: peptidoglycan DD-metalloendopeptidase family protein [Nitriliruptoraceae bacterium]
MIFRHDHLIAGLAAVMVVVTATSTAHAQSLSDIRGRLAEVRSTQATIADRLDATQQQLQELHARTAELEREQQRLRAEIAASDAQVEEITDQVSSRIRESYKHGSSLDPVAVFLSSDDPAGALARAETIRWLVAGDQTRIEDLAAARARNEAARARLAESRKELDDATEQFDALTASLEADLAELGELESSLSAQERAELERIEQERRERERREREQREREAAERRARQAAQEAAAESSTPAPTSSGGLVCPIGRPNSFIDSWGYPRSGGRRHRGTDLMSPHGTAIHAITDGVWTHQRRGRSAGIWGVLRGDNGDRYWYLHLSSHVAADGVRVSAGERIATNGSTGNATTPHLHFELHPGGGSAINPYPLLRSLC